MRPEERHLLAVARAIAERSPVDWVEADGAAADGSLRETLRELRVIAEIAALHGSDRQGDSAECWGPLTLLEHIGHGSFGDVYRALDTRLDREVALKLMRRSEIQADDLGTTVIEEARLLARVRHPNVVTIYGADRIEGRVGLWMEFVRGRTLEELLQARGPLPSDEVSTIGRGICEALAAVHQAGLLHRDIKAQNVVQEPDGRLVLMDFGAGRETGDGDEEAFAGTPLYLAPEVLEGRPASVQSDIYSVEVLLYHLLTGSYPASGRTVREIRHAHRRGTGAALGAGVSPALAAVVRRSLDPDPARRYGLAAEMAAALGKTRLRHKRIVGPSPVRATALVVMVLTVFAAWLLWTRAVSPSGERALERAQGLNGTASLTTLGQDDPQIEGPQLECYGCGDEGGSIDSSGRWMALTDRSGFDPYHLVVRDTTRTHRRDTQLQSGERGTAFFPVLSSVSRKVAFAWRTPEGRAQLRVIASVEGSQPAIVVDDAAYVNITPAAWSTDDRSILATVKRLDQSADLVWITVADGTVTVLKPLGLRLQGVKGRPTLSPDGRYVAYSALALEPSSTSEPPDSTDQHIYILAADFSGRERAVVQDDSINEVPIWANDGAILFLSNLAGTWDLRLVPIRNGEAAGVPMDVWKDLGCRCVFPHGISPAGRLFYTKAPPVVERTMIVEMEPPGVRAKGMGAVTQSLEGTLPSWSPHGDSIATKVKAPGGPVRTVESRDFETIVYSTGVRMHFPRPARRNPVLWARDGPAFFETVRDEHGAESLYRVEVPSGTVRHIFDFPSSVFTATMAPFFQVSHDGQALYAFTLDVNGRPRRLASLDLTSRRTKTILELPGDGTSLALSPDGNTLAFSFVADDGSTTSLHRVDVDGANHWELYSAGDPRDGQVPGMLTWASDRGVLFVMEESRLPVDLPTRALGAAAAKGSRDQHTLTNQRVMYVDANLIPPSPPTPTRIEVQEGRLQGISSSPDGSKLAYGLSRAAQELWSLDLSPILRAPK